MHKHADFYMFSTNLCWEETRVPYPATKLYIMNETIELEGKSAFQIYMELKALVKDFREYASRWVKDRDERFEKEWNAIQNTFYVDTVVKGEVKIHVPVDHIGFGFKNSPFFYELHGANHMYVARTHTSESHRFHPRFHIQFRNFVSAMRKQLLA